MARFTRRLFGITGLAAVTVAGGSIFACNRSTQTAVTSFEPLDVLLAGMRDPLGVGQSYRAEYGLSTLTEAAQTRHWIVSALGIACPDTRYDFLTEGVRHEFRTGEIALCNRFVLSKTECIVAGLRYDRVNGPLSA